MLKRLLFFAIAFLCMVSVSSCSFINRYREPYATIDPELPPYYFYGYNEKCTNGEHYLKVIACDVTTEYKDFADKAKASGYFLVVTVDTNLTDEDFASPQNRVIINFPFRDEVVQMNYLSYEEVNDKVVYEFPKLKNFDYWDLRYLQMYDGEISPDTRAVCFVFDFEMLNHGNFTLDGEEYSESRIRANMKY